MFSLHRKRGRNAEEENSSEFMPLSKRINNLHINNFSRLPEAATEKMNSQWEEHNLIASSNHSEPSRSPSSDGYSSSQSYTSDYSPDLNSNQNPYYYETNKLLYDLYVERMQRINTLY